MSVADPQGLPLVIDPGGRLVTTFDASDPDQLRPLVDAIELVLAKLTALGLDAFPAYGTLLGAVRDGTLIGHDNDADVGLPEPAHAPGRRDPRVVPDPAAAAPRRAGDLPLQRRRVQGRPCATATGVPRGLDVFAGFLYDDHLVLLGEIFAPFDEAWLRPLGTVELEGRRLPAPAEPDRLLAAMYGPSWRVPDPTFKFETDERIRHRLDVWFRGTRTHRNGWDRRYSTSRHRGPIRKPHELARMLHRAEPADATVIDVGCGRGQDAVWLAERGHRVFGLDFSPNGFAHLRDRAEEESWSVELAELNLLELRHTLAWGARLARVDGPRALLVRQLLNATTERGRENLWRLAEMTLGDGGRMYAEFLVAARGPTAPVRRPPGVGPRPRSSSSPRRSRPGRAVVVGRDGRARRARAALRHRGRGRAVLLPDGDGMGRVRLTLSETQDKSGGRCGRGCAGSPTRAAWASGWPGSRPRSTSSSSSTCGSPS